MEGFRRTNLEHGRVAAPHFLPDEIAQTFYRTVTHRHFKEWHQCFGQRFLDLLREGVKRRSNLCTQAVAQRVTEAIREFLFLSGMVPRHLREPLFRLMQGLLQFLQLSFLF